MKLIKKGIIRIKKYSNGLIRTKWYINYHHQNKDDFSNDVTISIDVLYFIPSKLKDKIPNTILLKEFSNYVLLKKTLVIPENLLHVVINNSPYSIETEEVIKTGVIKKFKTSV